MPCNPILTLKAPDYRFGVERGLLLALARWDEFRKDMPPESLTGKTHQSCPVELLNHCRVAECQPLALLGVGLGLNLRGQK